MGKSMHKGHYGHYSGNYKFSKDHAHTRVTKENYKATERDDAAHIDYLKRDIDYDAHHGHSDEKMTADEKHISKLAGDMKYDKEHHGSPAKNIIGAAGKAAKMAAQAAQSYKLATVREQAKEAMRNMRLSRGGQNATTNTPSHEDLAQMGSGPRPYPHGAKMGAAGFTEALDKLQSGGSSNKKLRAGADTNYDRRDKDSYFYDEDFAADAGPKKSKEELEKERRAAIQAAINKQQQKK